MLGQRASRASPTAQESAPRPGQPGGSGSSDPSARFPAGRPRRRRGPQQPANVPGLPGPHPTGIARAAGPSPPGLAAAAARWRRSSRRGCAKALVEPSRRVLPGPIPRRRSPPQPPACAVAGHRARARAPADRVRDYGGGTPPDRYRRARRRQACRFPWQAPGSRGAAAGQGPACPPPRSGRGGAGPPLSGQAGRRRRQTRPGHARRYRRASAAGRTRPPHPGGNAPPPRPTSPTRPVRPAPPGQDREARQQPSVRSAPYPKPRTTPAGQCRPYAGRSPRPASGTGHAAVPSAYVDKRPSSAYADVYGNDSPDR